MSFSTTYKPLFQVNILHKYYLNKGIIDYFSMNDADKEQQLASYELSRLFTIVPSAKTNQKMLGHKLLCNNTNSGFLVWAKVTETNKTIPFIPLSDSLELTFLLKSTNNTFIHITQLGLLNTGHLFFFSNKRLATEDAGFP